MKKLPDQLLRVLLVCIAAFLASGDSAEAADDGAIVALINQLVVTKTDTFLMDGRSYLGREAGARINRASEQLRAAGKDAWPQLFSHLSDRRESTPSEEVNGPYDVGQKCYFILRNQIMDLPQGYPYQKVLASHQISFRPSIETWLKQRQDRSIDEIRYEVIAILIDMESYSNNRKAGDLLKPHLAIIEERVKQASMPRQQQAQPIPDKP
jgi:hypothetical protein